MSAPTTKAALAEQLAAAHAHLADPVLAAQAKVADEARTWCSIPDTAGCRPKKATSARILADLVRRLDATIAVELGDARQDVA